MQPTLAITAPAQGMIYANGRFAGEAAPDSPLLLPVHAFGPVYLEYRPLLPGFAPLARKLVLSAGAPMPDGIPEDLFLIRWPDGVTEVELSAPEEPSESAEDFSLDGLSCRLCRGSECHIEIGAVRCALPHGAQIPELYHLSGCLALIGDAADDRYLLTLSADGTRQTGFLRAGRMEFESPEILRASVFRGDVAGHGTLERWRMGDMGLQLISSEPVWSDGAPRRPASPEEAARAAVEAALLDAHDEAASYLAPALRARFSLDHIGEICDLCVSMKYAPANGRACVGLLRMESGNYAIVRPLYYQAQQLNGEWMLQALEAENLL